MQLLFVVEENISEKLESNQHNARAAQDIIRDMICDLSNILSNQSYRSDLIQHHGTLLKTPKVYFNAA